MKIAVISSSAPFGKGESFVISEANAIATEGHEVLLIPTQLRRGNPNRFELHEKVRLLAQSSISFRVLASLCMYALKSPKHFFSLFRWVTDKSVLNSIKNYLVLPKAIWLSEQLKQKNIEHIHAHWLTTSATLAMVSSYLTGIPWSCTAHRGDIVSHNLLEMKCENAAFIRFISNSGVALATSRADIAAEKTHVLHLGVTIPELDRTSDSYAEQPGARPFTVLCPANLIPVKGHVYLLNALAKMQFSTQIQLILAGDGELREKLTTQVIKLGMHNQVHFKGHVPHSELLSWYRHKQVDLVVLPSLDLGQGLHEGIPVSLMEAMAYGIPVISTRTGGIPELLQNEQGDVGGLVAPADADGLAILMDKFVETPETRAMIAERGYQQVKAFFNQKKTVTALLMLIEQNIQSEKNEL